MPPDSARLLPDCRQNAARIPPALAQTGSNKEKVEQSTRAIARFINLCWNSRSLPDGTYDVFVVNWGFNSELIEECVGAAYKIYIQNEGVMTSFYEGFAPRESDCVVLHAYGVACQTEIATSFVVGSGAEGSGTEESEIYRSSSIDHLLDDAVVALLDD